MGQKENDVTSFFREFYNRPKSVESYYQEYFFKQDMDDFEKAFMWADICSWLPNESLLRSDKMSMAFGLEQRVPILDHRLVELSLRIPTRWKINGQEKKTVFREAMQQYIPDFILREPKRGWASPASSWLRNELKPIVYDVLTPSYVPETQEFFDFGHIRNMLDNHVEFGEYHMNMLWALMTFQIWYKQFLSV